MTWGDLAGGPALRPQKACWFNGSESRPRIDNELLSRPTANGVSGQCGSRQPESGRAISMSSETGLEDMSLIDLFRSEVETHSEVLSAALLRSNARRVTRRASTK